jgi:hypothetical protein
MQVIERKTNHMVVTVGKYKRHSEYCAMDQEKFFGKKNTFLNAAVFSEDNEQFLQHDRLVFLKSDHPRLI